VEMSWSSATGMEEARLADWCGEGSRDWEGQRAVREGAGTAGGEGGAGLVGGDRMEMEREGG
jgi:hypothetical protein